MSQTVEVRLASAVRLALAAAIALVTLLLGKSVYDDLYQVILDGFARKLRAISTTTGAFIDGDLHRQIHREDGALYQHYVQPMRRIRQDAGITYLYTQIPHSEPQKCIYILDANEDEDHPELGTADDLPEESVLGQRRVLERGEVFLSSVRSWDQWGLLKVAFAPIFDRRGEVSAIAGADVNISIIRDKTRASLLRVLATGGLSLVVGLYVAGLIARKITGPVAAIKQAALTLTAGRYGQRIDGGRLVELHRLSTGLSGIGGTLERTLDQQQQTYEDYETRRRLQEMEDHLLQSLQPEAPAGDPVWRWTATLDGSPGSGSTITPSGTWIWIAPSQADPQEALRRRHAVAHALEGALATSATEAENKADTSTEPDDPWAPLRHLYPQWVVAFLWLPADTTTVHWMARRRIDATVIDPRGRPQAKPLKDEGTFELAPGSILELPSEVPPDQARPKRPEPGPAPTDLEQP